MKKSCLLLLIVSCAFSVFAFTGIKHKATFSEKDIFQTANFLKNVPGFLGDYQGRDIRYFASHDGVNVFLTDQGPIYELTQIDMKKLKELQREKEREHKKSNADKEEEIEALQTIGSCTTVKWVGANPHPVIEPINKSNGYFTFLAGKTEKELHSIVTDGFSKVLYHDIYPGIDVEYSFPDKGGMKYNFIVHPGADMSRIQMEYGGAIKKLSKSADSNIIVHSGTGDLIEHMPVSYTEGGTAVASAYEVEGNKVKFSLPAGYDHGKTLIIDPWVTALSQLTVRNLGSSVDYDVAGNLYVYGAGASYAQDQTNLQKVAKFDASGNFLWVFMGSVPSVSWSTLVGGYNELSNARVDKVSNKVYVGQGFNYAVGNQIIRLTSAGVYDNFISVANTNFQETWSLVSNCVTGDILSLGGGTSSDLNMGVINPTTGIVSTSNITGVTNSYFQDIVSGAYDAFGNLYVVIASSATFSVNNYIYKCNPTYTGNVWGHASGYSSFAELNNLPAFDTYTGANSNNANALDANGSYLYYYDGHNLAAYSLTTGLVVGTSTTIAGYSALSQGGIAVDNCNHIYVGGKGVIKTFTFNGTTFTAGADIPLGGSFSSDTINDVRYDASNNLLYVTGSAVVGTYVATLSASCSNVSTLTAVVTATCDQASVVVTPGTGLINPVFSYLWEDSVGNVIRQTTPGTTLLDTLTGIGGGRYTVQVQLNVNCGGSTFIDTFNIICNNLVHSPDTTICQGQSATLSATGTPLGGTYSWMPGSGTGSTFTVTPSVSTTYFVTYTPPSGPAITDSIRVTVVTSATVSVPDTMIICAGQDATLTATPSVVGGTYSWTPGGGNTQTITVAPGTSTMYTVTYTTTSCGVAVDSGLVVVLSSPTLSVNDVSICPGGTATLTATSSVSGGSYSWSPGGATTQSIIVSPTTNTTYTVVYSTASCGSATDSGTVTLTTGATVSVQSDTICQGQSAVLTAIPSAVGGSYSWSPGGATTQSITVTPASATEYTVAYTLSGCGPVVDSALVSFYPGSTITLNPIAISCFGDSNGLITSTIQPAGSYSYLWSNHVTTANDSNLTAGSYTLIVTDVHGCVDSLSANIAMPAPASLMVLPADTTVQQGDTIVLNSYFGGYPVSSVNSYTWQPATGLSCTNCPNPMVYTNLYNDSINIDTLIVSYGNGCIVETYDTIKIKYSALLGIPNAFSPNGDSKNDLFFILAKGVSDFSLHIYNRWGQEVFISNDINVGWDGSYKGKQQPGGVYQFFFTITYQNGKSENHSGAVTLLR